MGSRKTAGSRLKHANGKQVGLLVIAFIAVLLVASFATISSLRDTLSGATLPVTVPLPPGVPSTATDGVSISFSSLAGYTYGYTTNFNGGGGGSIKVSVPRNLEFNAVILDMSDRAYDPNNITLFFQTASGTTLATGTLSEWGPYGNNGGAFGVVPLSQLVTVAAGAQYQMSFSSVDNTYGVTQDFYQTAAPSGTTGYLGQSAWPIFYLALMNPYTTTSGLANYGYYGVTDFQDSPGYQNTAGQPIEVGMRFQVTQSEQILSFEVEAMSTDGTNDPLVFTLRNSIGSSATTPGHPEPLSDAPALATSQVTASQVRANMTTGYQCDNIASDTCTLVKTYFTNDPQLAPGYYWIVMDAPDGDVPVTLVRDVTARNELVYVSGNDFTTTSGTPLDGPTDLSFRITTTGQSIIQTVLGMPQNEGVNGVAQSFTPTATSQIKGVWTAIAPAGDEVTVSVQTDSGKDSPSGTMLTQSTVDGDTGLTYGYVGLPTITLDAGTKYWLTYTVGSCVISSLCSYPFKAISNTYNPDFYGSRWDFQGTSSHFEYQSGSSWVSPANMGDMPFEFVAPTGHESDSIWSNPNMTLSSTTSTISTSTVSTHTSTVTVSGSMTGNPFNLLNSILSIPNWLLNEIVKLLSGVYP